MLNDGWAEVLCVQQDVLCILGWFFHTVGQNNLANKKIAFYSFFPGRLTIFHWSRQQKVSIAHGKYSNLINNPRMFNLGIEDLAEKSYIPQKKILLWICCKCLAWWHRHTYFWPPLRLLEAKHHAATAHFSTVGRNKYWVKVPKCVLTVWCLASNSIHGGQICSPYQPTYLEF